MPDSRNDLLPIILIAGAAVGIVLFTTGALARREPAPGPAPGPGPSPVDPGPRIGIPGVPGVEVGVRPAPIPGARKVSELLATGAWLIAAEGFVVAGHDRIGIGSVSTAALVAGSGWPARETSLWAAVGGSFDVLGFSLAGVKNAILVRTSTPVRVGGHIDGEAWITQMKYACGTNCIFGTRCC